VHSFSSVKHCIFASSRFYRRLLLASSTNQLYLLSLLSYWNCFSRQQMTNDSCSYQQKLNLSCCVWSIPSVHWHCCLGSRLGWTSGKNLSINSSVCWHSWLGERRGIWPIKNSSTPVIIKGQLANPGSPGKWSIKRPCVCVYCFWG